jgi:hypothetical protein
MRSAAILAAGILGAVVAVLLSPSGSTAAVKVRTGITIDRNTALGIWGDLRDHHAAGVNSYGRNKFGTTFFGDK